MPRARWWCTGRATPGGFATASSSPSTRPRTRSQVLEFAFRQASLRRLPNPGPALRPRPTARTARRADRRRPPRAGRVGRPPALPRRWPAWASGIPTSRLLRPDRSGAPPEQDVARAASRADLLVVGTDQRGVLGRLVGGSCLDRDPRACEVPGGHRAGAVRHEPEQERRAAYPDLPRAPGLAPSWDGPRSAPRRDRGSCRSTTSWTVLRWSSAPLRTASWVGLRRGGRIAFEVDDIDSEDAPRAGAWSPPDARRARSRTPTSLTLLRALRDPQPSGAWDYGFSTCG